MKVVIIPARGGSQRIKGKNTKVFHGRPIIGYSIDVARASKIFDKIVVSTEDKSVASVARSAGADIVDRPKALAEDDIGTQEVIRHAIDALKLDDKDVVCCLYPTAPLLLPLDLQMGYHMLMLRPCSYVISVGSEPLRDIGNYYMGFASLFRSQMPLCTIQTGVYPIPIERAIDINSVEDWEMAEAMYEKLHGKKLARA